MNCEGSKVSIKISMSRPLDLCYGVKDIDPGCPITLSLIKMTLIKL